MSKATKRAKVKSVEAWAVVSKEHNQIWAMWTFDDKEHLDTPPGFNPEFDKWVRVRITPIPAKKRSRR